MRVRKETNMNDKVKITLDYLNHWKNAFMSGSDWSYERNLGMTEITDELSGINENGSRCFASDLFSKLTDEDKADVLNNIDFYVNFDELYAIYDL